MKFILIKVDKGDVWEITGTTVTTDSSILDENMVMEIDNRKLFDYIKLKLESAQIQIPKSVRGKLIKEDLIEIEYDYLTVYKERTIHSGREYLSSRLNVASLFDYIDFIMANNVLLSHGFFVTPENKKDLIIQIINTEDTKLIEALETYTSVQTKLVNIDGWWKVFKDFESRVYNAINKSEIDEAYKIFIQIFG